MGIVQVLPYFFGAPLNLNFYQSPPPFLKSMPPSLGDDTTPVTGYDLKLLFAKEIQKLQTRPLRQSSTYIYNSLLSNK